MSRTTALNIILGLLAAGLVAILGFLKLVDPPVAAPVPVAPTTLVEKATTSAASSIVTTTSTTTTLPAETTTTSSTFPVATTLVPPGERGFTGVLVVNGTSAGERLAPVIERLRAAGYVDVRGVVGGVQATETSVYYVDGALPLAQRLATDLGFVLGEIAVEPIADAPPVAGVGTAFVMVYLGSGELPDPPPVTDPEADSPPATDAPPATDPPPATDSAAADA